MMNQRNYDVGLDIGTNSLGWAVVTEKGLLEKFKNRNMWGAVLFEDGQSASTRRKFRSSRRRLIRRRQRIQWAQELFGPLVLNEDPDFYKKLKNSYISPEDKASFSPDLLFSEEFFLKHEFQVVYPTIYHLRKAIMNSEQKIDPRLIYLCVHHIIKYRGNFLYQGQQISIYNLDIESSIQALLQAFELVDEDDTQTVSAIASEFQKSRRKGETKDACVALLSPLIPESIDKPKAFATQMVNLILGYKGDLSILFGLEDKLMTSFSDESYLTAEDKLDDGQIEKLEALQKVYSGFVLLNILTGEVKTLSDAYIAKYNDHKKDLSTLKDILKEYSKDYINPLINDLSKKSYAAYIKSTRSCSLEDLYKEISKVCKEMPLSDPRVQYCLTRMEDEVFLLKPRNSENGAIPNQLHVEELKKILENQKRFYPELEAISDKLISIAEYRIPYYVGALTGPFSWMVRKAEGKIYPWNIFDMVDRDASAAAFIQRMTNQCSYLYSEDVLPKNSILLSQFNVLNELANIKINGQRLSPECKLAALVNLFSKTKTITKAKFVSWLLEHRFIPSKSVDVSGFSDDKGFISNLSSLIDFSSILGPLNSENLELAEKLITWITIFSDKDILDRKIRLECPMLTDNQVLQIVKLRYKGWGRLSRKLIDGIYGHDETGRPVTIIQVLRETSLNFMEILAGDDLFGFNELIAQENKEKKSFASKKDLVLSYPGSPALKKATWVAVRVLDEIEKIMGTPPRSVYIEVARGDEDKKQTLSRYSQLDNKLKNIKDTTDFIDIHKELQSKFKADKKKLDNKRLLLYFLQNGKCLYSGIPLNIDNISSYQLDHILPQCYVKDDSIDNLALVLSTENQRKKDSLLLNDSIVQKQEVFWHQLLKENLISRKKYENLIRREIDENIVKGFIARQLVETRQVSKYVFESLKEVYPETNVYGISAKLSANIRGQLHLPKVREVNDYHHAQDAFLAARAGFFIQKRFSQVPSVYKEIYSDLLNNAEIEKKERYGLMASLFSKSIFGWNGFKESSNLKKAFNFKDYFLNRLVEEQTSDFYKQIPLSKNDHPEKLIPKKKGQDPKFYGGYTGEQDAFFCIIRYLQGKKEQTRFVGVPIRIASLASSNPKAIQEYFEQQGYANTTVIKDHILKYQHIIYHEQDEENEFYIVGSNEVINARQLLLSNSSYVILSRILKNKTQAKISDLEFQSLYFELCKKMMKYPVYAKLASSLALCEESFMSLPFLDKVDTIKKILIVMQANSARVEKGDWKISKEAVSLSGSRLSKSLKPENIEFINSSITGMFSSSVFYLTKKKED